VPVLTNLLHTDGGVLSLKLLVLLVSEMHPAVHRARHMWYFLLAHMSGWQVDDISLGSLCRRRHVGLHLRRGLRVVALGHVDDCLLSVAIINGSQSNRPTDAHLQAVLKVVRERKPVEILDIV
jgi:hypothetical protein